MIKDEYIVKIKEILEKHLVGNERVFVFGSSVDRKNFADVDLAISSEKIVDDKVMRDIKECLEESTLPYRFDVVDVNQTKDPFRTRVLNGKKIWII